MGSIRKHKFGEMPDGRAVDLYTLVNLSGLEARIMIYGRTLVSWQTPNRNGALADVVLGLDEKLIPLGEKRPVLGTPFDFTRPETIASRVHADEPQLGLEGGYDHCWVLNKMIAERALAAELQDPQSGRTLSVFTIRPGMHLYTETFSTGAFAARAKQAYERHSGLSLETQHFPDSPNQPTFPTTLLRRGENYLERRPSTGLDSAKAMSEHRGWTVQSLRLRRHRPGR